MLKELNVKVGDRVTPGQLLARIDDFRIRNLRDLSRTSLASAQANLDRVVQGVTVQNAQKSVDQAKRSFDRAKKSVDAQIEAAEDSERRAEIKFSKDLQVLYESLNKSMTRDECYAKFGPDRLNSSKIDRSSGSSSFAMDATAGTANGFTDNNGGGSGGNGSGNAAVPGGSGIAGLTSLATQQCNDAAVTTAFNAALTSKSALVTAQNASRTAKRGAKVTIEASRTSLVTAENTLRSAVVDKPITISQLRALVQASRLSLANADQDLRDTTLFSPATGTVAAINGVIGEYVGGGSGTSAQSPGSDAPIPGVGAAASSDQAGAAASGISATKPGGAAFIVLNNLNTFQVVVPFEESDAAKIQPTQKVDVKFDSLPGLVKTGTVLSKSPSGVNISGVTNYYVTVLLDSGDPKLTTGLTAQVGVISRQVDNVLTVPNAAITKKDGRSVVNVTGPDGKVTEKGIQTGAVGDSTTEVVGGLSQGDQVVLPAAASPAVSN
jgi:HlyD family secretion protein